ncbi:MAG: hypothetical protein GKR87_11255 [Kiritimatiellae bacterium]|nr:hypothetical protein [Kiritimatiellia bacterium]
MRTYQSFSLSLLFFFPCALSTFTNETSRVNDGGGGISGNSQYIALAAIGQGTPVGFSANATYLNHGRFLHSETLQPSSPDTDTGGDSDGDGISDWEELTGSAFDPITPTSAFSDDSDGDSMSDGDELSAGTNPTDPRSLFQIRSIAEANGQQILQWSARATKQYEVLMASFKYEQHGYWNHDCIGWNRDLARDDQHGWKQPAILFDPCKTMNLL